jgi:hypothetical protein
MWGTIAVMNRREFLKSLAALASALGLTHLAGVYARTLNDEPVPPVYLPLVTKQYRAGRLNGKVIHIHAPSVTNWNFDYTRYYGRTQAPSTPGVNQAVVDAMVDRGVAALFGLPPDQAAEAWARLIPDYAEGKRVAIKINLNNSFSCATTDDDIDAIAQPINAVIRGLKMLGIGDQDIILYDAIRFFPDRLYQELAYKNVQIHDNGCRGHISTWTSADPNAKVKFFPPTGSLPTVRLSDTLIGAQYLINMPIMKGHPIAGVTLNFKNHFGSTNNPSGMHAYVSTAHQRIEQYNALVDLNSNPHIRDKTVLILGDGIYGSRRYQDTPPQPWSTFDNQSPCSLFFATDPVAVDCVMHDLLKAERGSMQPTASNAYLRLASQAGLGFYESGNPWQLPYGSGYSQIIYERIEL